MAVGAPILAACGGDRDEAQRAVERFNRASASVLLRDAVKNGGGISVCRITRQEVGPGNLVLTAVMTSDGWLQATIDPDQPVRSEDVTTGTSFTDLFGAQAEADLRKQGRACSVSAADGTVSLG